MKHAARLSSAVLVLLLAGCASNPSHPDDPLEPLNRSIYGFNTHLDRAIFKPAAETYRSITPQPVRTAVGNFFDNLRDVVSLANNALQGRAERTLNDLFRVGLNSTFGVFGLLNIADPAGLKNYKAGFGDTLATWGWQQSTYLVLPVFGPSNVRDGIGLAADTFTVPPHVVYANQTQQYTAFGLNFLDRRVSLLGIETAVDEAALDPYAYTRDAYIQLREHQLGLDSSGGPHNNGDIKIDDLVSDDTKPAAAASASASAPAAQTLKKIDASAAQ